MSQSNSTPPPPSRLANRPPRINIKNLQPTNNGTTMPSVPSSGQPPFTAQTTHTLPPGSVAGQPYWPQYSNPFAAGNFMARGFDGIVDFTKSGMSFGEKFTYGLYEKISKWSRRWFTHFFLLTVMSLYSVGGALLFQAIEGGKVTQERIEAHAVQKEFFRAMKALADNHQLRRYSSAQFDGKIIFTLRDHQTAVETLLNSNKTLEEMENEENPWSFWNAMFYCGTIYTTIDDMEDEHQEAASTTHTRRRRRIGRSVREKTPDPSKRRTSSTEDDSSMMGGASEGAQFVSMQIRPPRSTMSAHESKILRRRDKTFAADAARSLSQPREAERLSESEASQIMQTVKRSLSMPRNKEQAESSEGELRAKGRTLSPEHSLISVPMQSTADENLSRLEQNVRRFERDRKRFETDKKLFEREKREHKLRYRQMLDHEERTRLLQSYRKLSDRIKLTQGEDERQRLINSLRIERNELDLPTFRAAAKRNRHCGNLEDISTQFSSSETEATEENPARRLSKQLSPVRRVQSALTSASVRGPPPQPPARRSLSRNNSLSPVRPERRSKTPDQRHDSTRSNNDLPEQQLLVNQKLRSDSTTTEFETDREFQLRQRKAQRRESLHRYETKRKQSLEKQPDIVDCTLPVGSKKQLLPQITISQAEVLKTAGQKNQNLFQRLLQFFKKTSPKEDAKSEEKSKTEKAQPQVFDKILSKAFLKAFITDATQQWRGYKAQHRQEIADIKRMRNRCFAHTILLILLLGFGGLMFRYTEGTAENIYKCEVRKVKRDFIDNLWSHSHSMREEDWKTLARQKLRTFEEELHTIGELGIHYFPGQKSWNFVNCILFCWTVITTIGYGHITPKTQLGQSLTIAYAIIGIPMFLILLADFGKLFTRVIKFVWGYVRGLYYTGTCRRIRKQQQVRDAMTGFSTVYDMAIRRPSQFFSMAPDTDIESQASEAVKSVSNSHAETPTSPYPETIVVDDEFNLPISLASILLITYILLGAFVYTLWEDWGYFEAFYFVFISMSTIGFGDLVPNHPIFMMCSIIYLIFGLALTSMFINVVQIKLSDTFKDASAKIGATLGVAAASEMGEDQSQVKTPSELASVHGSRLNKIAEVETEALTSGISPSAVQGGELQPPPLLPRRQTPVEQLPVVEKKKKRRFFK